MTDCTGAMQVESAVHGRGKNITQSPRSSRRGEGQGWYEKARMVAETRRILAQRATRRNRRRAATAVAPDWKARALSRPRRFA